MVHGRLNEVKGDEIIWDVADKKKKEDNMGCSIPKSLHVGRLMWFGVESFLGACVNQKAT